MADKNEVVDMLKMGALIGFGPLGILKGSEFLINKAQELKKDGTIDQLSEEAKKQDLYYQMLEYQAKYAQELAISQRIAFAEEVEIEEYYEGEGEGSLGLNAREGKFSLGASGSGRKVTKRVYRFTGLNATILEAAADEKLINEHINFESK